MVKLTYIPIIKIGSKDNPSYAFVVPKHIITDKKIDPEKRCTVTIKQDD